MVSRSLSVRLILLASFAAARHDGGNGPSPGSVCARAQVDAAVAADAAEEGRGEEAARRVAAHRAAGGGEERRAAESDVAGRQARVAHRVDGLRRAEEGASRRDLLGHDRCRHEALLLLLFRRHRPAGVDDADQVQESGGARSAVADRRISAGKEGRRRRNALDPARPLLLEAGAARPCRCQAGTAHVRRAGAPSDLHQGGNRAWHSGSVLHRGQPLSAVARDDRDRGFAAGDAGERHGKPSRSERDDRPRRDAEDRRQRSAGAAAGGDRRRHLHAADAVRLPDDPDHGELLRQAIGEGASPPVLHGVRLRGKHRASCSPSPCCPSAASSGPLRTTPGSIWAWVPCSSSSRWDCSVCSTSTSRFSAEPCCSC